MSSGIRYISEQFTQKTFKLSVYFGIGTIISNLYCKFMRFQNMSKRSRGVLNTLSSADKRMKQEPRVEEIWGARGRLKGALLEALEPPIEDTDSDDTEESRCGPRRVKCEQENGEADSRSPSPQRATYVLKLFDRSVDLAQFEEDSPLYPVCRAWILNQPRAIYNPSRDDSSDGESEELVTLPCPHGPPVSRVPHLLPEQRAASKHNVNLNYKEVPPVSRDRLLHDHLQRWSAVRDSWLAQAQRCEARHVATQDMLDKLHVSM